MINEGKLSFLRMAKLKMKAARTTRQKEKERKRQRVLLEFFEGTNLWQSCLKDKYVDKLSLKEFKELLHNKEMQLKA